MQDPPGRYVLPLIIFSQFAGTSLWFAGNAVISGMQADLHLPPASLGWITSTVQLGFITGTLLFALLALADRFSPVRLFLLCSVLAAACTAAIAALSPGLWPMLLLRFCTGFFLAGIYPVGMKIAADWYGGSLGKAIGYLVGALVLGTAFPHLVRALGGQLPWQAVLWSVSALAITGGLLLALFVGDGPGRQAGARFRPGVLSELFYIPSYRAASFGYFGHMWELYAFWALVPVWMSLYSTAHEIELPISLLSFLIIGLGAISCALGGHLSVKRGSAWVARVCLAGSGFCCLLSPLLFFAPVWVFIPFLILWGLLVIGDSAQFSALAAAEAPAQYRGTALTIMSSIGFFITIGSIQLLTWLSLSGTGPYLFLLLLPGPALGLFAMRRLG